MKVAYFDCFSGTSGDMLLGALVDAGLEFSWLQRQIGVLPMKGLELRSRRMQWGTLHGTKVDVVVHPQKRKTWTPTELKETLTRSRLDDHTKQNGLAIVDRHLAAERKQHGKALNLPAEEALDMLVDVVGTVSGLHHLGVEEIWVSPINVGRGVAPTSHGPLPVPTPAAAELLRGFPVFSKGPAAELTTPTGAAILTTLARPIPSLPPLRLARVGYGAGTRQYPDWPNLLRLFVGEAVAGAAPEPPETTEREKPVPAAAPAPAAVSLPGLTQDSVQVLETHLDDLSPQIYEHVIERLLTAGALDATLTPVIMKKGRPAVSLTVLAPSDRTEPLVRLIFAETSSLGIRVQTAPRVILPREIHTLQTPLGTVHVKSSTLPDGTKQSAPEYEDCRLLAQKTGRPLREVLRIVERELLKRHR
jgi:uncharacterized protein (TIGR00299 family) protein